MADTINPITTNVLPKNLTPEELQNLQALNQEFTQVKLKLADSVYQQVLFTKDLDTIRGKFSSVEKELSEKAIK